MTIISKKNQEIDIELGKKISALAIFLTFTGVMLGTVILLQNEGFFKGSAGYLNIVLGSLFIRKGIKMLKNPEMKSKEKALIPDPRKADVILYVGAGATAFLTGLIGIGGGMNYVLIFMICRGFLSKKATGTAMMITTFSTLTAASVFLFISLNAGLLIPANVSFLAILVGMSAFGTILGAKLAFSLSEAKINILIGTIVVIAATVATVQSFILK
jgi:uncharacterized membrane protein YfcA